MTINREHFEAWLFSQPKEKQLNYLGGRPDSDPGCLMCCYLRENFKIFDFRVAAASIAVKGQHNPLPIWCRSLLSFLSGVFTIAEAQAEYLKLFPDTVPALPVHDAGVVPEPVKVNLE